MSSFPQMDQESIPRSLSLVHFNGQRIITHIHELLHVAGMNRDGPLPSRVPLATSHKPTNSNVFLEQGHSPQAQIPQILMFSDQIRLASYLQSLLHPTFEIIAFNKLHSGLKPANHNYVDLIIIDLLEQAPAHKELTMVGQLKKVKRFLPIPIILLTDKVCSNDLILTTLSDSDSLTRYALARQATLIRQIVLQEKPLPFAVRYSKLDQREVPYSTSKQDAATEKPLANDSFWETIREIIDTKLGDPDLDIPYLCKVTNLSPSQLYRKIKSITGISPIKFIRNLRLQKAKHLLENTQLSISEIAYELGFSDPNYFSRAFSKTFGVPPTLIRK